MSSIELRILSAARQDIVDALSYYSQEAGNKIADALLDEIESLWKRLRTHPDAFPRLAASSYRRASLNRFPYAVLYVHEGNVVRIVCIGHQKRGPAFWQSRMK